MLTIKVHKSTGKAALVATVAAALISSAVVAQSLPATAACSTLTRAHFTDFRGKVGAAIVTLTQANIAGQATRASYGGSTGGAWNNMTGLRVIADHVDENAFLSPPCRSMFYPSGLAVPNNINACFRDDVTAQLETEMYWTTVHAYYNKAIYPSHASAVAAFNAVRDLLKESRSISNAATSCLLQSGGEYSLNPN
jgi:hypothetical protein